MKLDYATPEANKISRLQPCHPLISFFGIVAYWMLTGLFFVWSAAIVWQIPNSDTMGLVASIPLTVFCGWRTISAIRCFRQATRSDAEQRPLPYP